MSGFLKVVFATASFAALHSLLASRKAKDAAASAIPRVRKHYRLLYNAQAVVTFGALVVFVSRQPRRTLYRIHGAAAVGLRAGQLFGIAFAVVAARATGVMTLAGLDARIEPAAQGPESGQDGELRIRGPFTIVRHPLNLAPLAPFWLTPHMTARRFAFNCVATLYLLAGSAHEESRLLEQYGSRYEAYRKSGVPFYVPRIGVTATAPHLPPASSEN